MALPSVTFTFVDATTIVHSQVNQNFTDIINAMTDGNSDYTIGSLTAQGAVTMNANVTLGNSTGDDITITGRIASDIDPKTAATNTLGDATQTWLALYLDGTATNGGTIYFDGSSTKFIRANAAGTDLLIDAFTTLTVDANIVPQTDATSSLGTSSLNYVDIHLDNSSTNGGTIYFDSSSTKFIRSNAAGTDLLIDAFTTLTVDANIVPQTDVNNTLGTASLNYTGIHLDNSTTDGGAVFFNAGTTAFLKSNAAGDTLSSGGFTTVALPAVTCSTTLGVTGISSLAATTISTTLGVTGLSSLAAVTCTGAFTSLGIDDNATSTAITITSDEFVGIGLVGPTGTCEIKRVGGSTDIFRVFADGDGATADAQLFSVNNGGTCGVHLTNWSSSSSQDIGTSGTTGNVNFVKFTSSKRYKKDIRPLDFDTSWIYETKPVNFTFINNEPEASASKSIGYIAEDISKIAPKEFVFWDDKLKREESLHYKLFVVPIIEEMKKLKAEIEVLKAG